MVFFVWQVIEIKFQVLLRCIWRRLGEINILCDCRFVILMGYFNMFYYKNTHCFQPKQRIWKSTWNMRNNSYLSLKTSHTTILKTDFLCINNSRKLHNNCLEFVTPTRISFQWIQCFPPNWNTMQTPHLGFLFKTHYIFMLTC